MEEEEKIKSNIKKYILSSQKYDNKKDHINIELKRNKSIDNERDINTYDDGAYRAGHSSARKRVFRQ